MKMHDFSAATPRSACLPSTRAATIPGKARFNTPIPPAWRSRRRQIRGDDWLVALREVAIACLWKAGGGRIKDTTLAVRRRILSVGLSIWEDKGRRRTCPSKNG
jgi:hypothetical protein